MPRVRLTGLFLFTTSIILGLASAATRTTHLRFQRPDSHPLMGNAETTPLPDSRLDPRLPQSGSQPFTDPQATQVETLQFISVPIIYPLSGIALSGLALWFIPAAIFPQPNQATSRSRKRRRKAPTAQTRSRSSQRRG